MIELNENINLNHAKSIPIPNIHKATLKKEVQRFISDFRK